MASRQPAVHVQLVGGTEARPPALRRCWSHEEDRGVSPVFGVSWGKSAWGVAFRLDKSGGFLEKASMDLVLSSGQFCVLPSCGHLASGDTLGCQDSRCGLGSGRCYWPVLGRCC